MMADLATSERRSSVPTPPTSAGAGASRSVRRRVALPNGRAVVGGFLVAVSLLALFAAYSGAAAGPGTSFVVARRDIPIGTRLQAGDLALRPMDLPDDIADGAAFRGGATLVGATTVGPIRKGELVQASGVVRSRGEPAELEVSFAIERAKALAGSLRPGERVDVLATFGSGDDSYTVVVVRQARVLDARRSDEGFAGDHTDVVLVAVASAGEALALTHALHAGDVTLVRASPEAAGAPPGGTYRAPAAPRAGGSTSGQNP